MSGASGYASAAYVRALGQQPVPLGGTGGHLVVRPVAGTGLFDLAGPYPIFSCPTWSALAEAVAGIAPGPVSLTLVSDPFAPLSEADLARIFPVCRKIHDHWVIDLNRPLEPSRHHRRMLKTVGPLDIQAGPADPGLGAEWARLYANLVARKGIRDSRAFSAESLAAQLAVPGAHVVQARDGGSLLGIDLYYIANRTAYAHLSAYSPEGYGRSVSYAMTVAACDYLKPLADHFDQGGAPAGAAGQGIAAFKSGWTSLTLPSYLCGKVLDPAAYARLAPGADPAEGFFPAYRAAEWVRPPG